MIAFPLPAVPLARPRACPWAGPRAASSAGRLLVLVAALCSAHVQAAAAQEEARAKARTLATPTLAGADDETPSRRSWDASVGFITSLSPEYGGAARQRVQVEPGFFVRWGRVSVASRGAFVVRSADGGGGGGVRVDLSRSERWRLGLGLRIDGGRRESSSPDLAGLGDIRRTFRARLSGSYRLDDGWRAGGAVTVDALDRDGGTIGEFTLGRDLRPWPRTSVGFGASLSFGDARHLQSYYGITPQQSARSGYPVYAPGAGLRSASLGVGARTAVGEDWVVLYGANVSRLLGPAAASPLTRRTTSWGLNAGLVYRF